MIQPYDDENRGDAAWIPRQSAALYLVELREVIEMIRRRSTLRMEARAWPSGLNRSVLHRLPLKVRTRNCLRSAHLMKGDNPLTVAQLMKIPNFGTTSLRDLVVTVEKFLKLCLRTGSTDWIQVGKPTERTKMQLNDVPVVSASMDVQQTQWERVEEILKPAITSAFGEGEVKTPCRLAAAWYLFELREVIETIRAGGTPRMGSQAWPSGLDRSILRQLPLKVRTWNCLHNADLMEGDNAITVEQFMSIRNFGTTSLRDLLFTVEVFLNGCIQTGSTDSHQMGRPSEKAELHSAETPVRFANTEEEQTQWELVEQVLKHALASAAEIHGSETLGDVLSPRFMKLADRIGIAEEINMIKIRDVIGGTNGLVYSAFNRLEKTLESGSAVERMIVEERILKRPRSTLDEIASRVELTRERIRQIQSNFESELQGIMGREGQIISSALKEQIGAVVQDVEMDRQIGDIIPTDESLASRFLHKALIDQMGYTLDHGMYLDRQAREQVENIVASVQRLSDDVGLLDKGELIASLPDEEWQRFWPWLRSRCGLHDLFGLLATRDSGKARAKAALISIGRSATGDEIARLCGLEETRVRSYLSVIPSVVRADKDRWGLRDWVDDVYEGIVGEIIQRVEEDGGVTTTKRLLTELPGKFGVSPRSVYSYMKTPKFVIRDDQISLANPSLIQLRDLDDVIDGQDRDGSPYWTFAVEDRFFDGYSVTGVPPEIAKALGCKPDGRESIRIDNVPNCPDLSIMWRLASTTGASIGYLAEPLKRLGIKPGERARVTIKGPCCVELGADRGNSERSGTTTADEIMRRMIQRRRRL